MNYIPEPIKQSACGFKYKIASLFKTNTPKKSVYQRGKKLSKSRKENIKKRFISKEHKKKLQIE